MPSYEELVSTFIRPRRVERFREVLARRLGCLTLVCEHVGDIRNVSACVRVADSFGLGTVVHYADGRYSKNRQISMHADRWVTVRNLSSFGEATDFLSSGGYAAVGAVVPEQGGVPFADIELPERMALVIGSERDGLTPEMRESCTALVTIPTFGFVESLNLATAAAILVQHFAARYRARGGEIGLPASEQSELLAAWVRRDLIRRLHREGPRGVRLLREAGLSGGTGADGP